jgi:hypothetical protein
VKSAENEPRAPSGMVGVVAAGLLLPILYVLSWGPVGALTERYGLQSTALEVGYAPIDWVVDKSPEAYGALDWYSRQFDFLKPKSDVRNIPEIWEKAWFIDMPDSATPYGTSRSGGVI